MRVIGLEVASRSGIMAVQTSGTGTAWVQLPDVKCAQLILYNATGTALRIRYCAPDGTARAGETYLPVADGVAQPLRGLNNAQQVQIQRADTSNTQVTAPFVFEAV